MQKKGKREMEFGVIIQFGMEGLCHRCIIEKWVERHFGKKWRKARLLGIV